ncbi:putative mitochondrial protein [Tanacetum coccineum]
MAPTTRTIASTSNNEDGGVNERLSGRNPNQQQFTRMTKMDFLKFSGDDVKGFGIVYDDPISEIRKVKYQPNVKEYQDAFDTLLSMVDISEEHAVSFYLGGLPTEIEMRSKTAMNFFRGKFGGGMGQRSNSKTPLLALPAPNTSWKPKPNTPLNTPIRKQLTQKEYQEKIAQNLCFYFDQKYTLGHKCSGKLYSLVVLADEDEEYFETMRVTGKVGKHKIHILVDCGSTHNFLDDSVAKRVGCFLKDTCPLAVTVGGRKELISTKACKDFVWQLQGETFKGDMMILPLGVCEMVLDAIEAMVKELLEAGVIKATNSPFASPIVMVKKKDNTWSMCMDYRKLNKNTVKDKFPIPIIKELIDELHGASIFSKLDLSEGHYEFLVMPFGLTNAPSTFQALMNEVFKAFLRKFTLVFFDDILVYSQTMEEHMTHLQLVLETIREHKLYVKLSKCVFGTTHLEYLGNVISKKGVSTEPNKVRAMQDWPIPTTLKQLKGFLGLTGYYRRFIKGFASLSRPLTQLLKKNAFKWNSEAHLSFEALKKAMVKAPNLGLPDFNVPFVIETDASGVGLGAVLQQKGHPIAYLKNGATDALSRLGSGNELLSMFVSSITTDIMKKVQDTWLTNNAVGAIITNLRNGQPAKQHYAWVNDKLLRKGKLVVGQDANLRRELLKYFHDDSIGDFIEGLPKSHGKDVIMVIVDRLSKYAHFIALSHPFNAAQIAQVFLDSNYKLHGMPELIVSDRDKVFINAFWKELFRALKVKLHMSTAYHPQTDGLTKVVNRSQNRMKQQTDKSRFEREFVVGDMVFLKLQPHRQVTIRMGKQNKFSQKFYGPFEVSAKVGQAAYKLKLPIQAQIHNVLHVSQLKKYTGPPLNDDLISLPQCDTKGSLLVQPIKLLDRKMVKKHNKVVVYGLVQWANGTVEDASWEDLGKLVAKFPEFDPSS